MKLNGKTALITGGTSGIGLATAELFVREGARVIITGRDAERLEQARAVLGGPTLAVQADVRSVRDRICGDERTHAARKAGHAGRRKRSFTSID